MYSSIVSGDVKAATTGAVIVQDRQRCSRQTAMYAAAASSSRHAAPCAARYSDITDTYELMHGERKMYKKRNENLKSKDYR